MTRKDKDILLKAAEYVFGSEEYSCNAVNLMEHGGHMTTYPAVLEENYGKFYEHDSTDSWGVEHDEDPRGWRVMLLLWFREVGLEGVQ